MSSAKTVEDIDEAYRSEPWWYDARGFLILTFAYRSTLPRQIRMFGRNMGENHLEVACGTGTLLEYILNWRRRKHMPNVKLTCVDYAEKMLNGAIHRFSSHTDMTFLKADAANMSDFLTDQFDTINIANSIHCLPQVKESFMEMFRVLKSGGTLCGNVLLHAGGWFPFKQLASSINRWGVRRGILVTAYAEEEIVEIVKSVGFLVLVREVHGNCLELTLQKPILVGGGGVDSVPYVEKWKDLVVKNEEIEIK